MNEFKMFGTEPAKKEAVQVSAESQPEKEIFPGADFSSMIKYGRELEGEFDKAVARMSSESPSFKDSFVSIFKDYEYAISDNIRKLEEINRLMQDYKNQDGIVMDSPETRSFLIDGSTYYNEMREKNSSMWDTVRKYRGLQEEEDMVMKK